MRWLGCCVACAVLANLGAMSFSQATETTPPVAAISVQSDQAVNAPKTFVLPQGTKILLSLTSAVNTKTAKPGDGVYLISTFPVTGDNRILIPVGVRVQGTLDKVVRPGRVKGSAKVSMHFTTVIFPNGTIVNVPGKIDSLPGSPNQRVKDGEGTIEQASDKGVDVDTILKGAAAGASAGGLGGAAAGNVGAGIGYGALAGAIAGGIYTLFQRGAEVNIPQGTLVEMVLQRPLTLEEENVTSKESKSGMTPSAQKPLKKPVNSGVVCPVGMLGCD
jgi:hypothetical protein